MTMISSSRIQKFVAVWIVVPCIIGCLISKFILPEGVLQELVEPYLLNITGRRLTTAKENVVPGSSSNVSSNCERNFQNLLGMTSENDPFEGIPVILHRNGEPTSCGDTGSLFLQNLKQNYALGECPAALDKYQVESLLTKTLNDIVETCFATEKNGKKRKNGFLGFCDMGPKNTPILLDHNDLVPVVSPGNKESLPCRFHTREGLQISQLNQLSQMAQAQTQCQLNPNEHEQSCSSEESSSAGSHLYAVPAGRVFMFAPSYVGEIFNLPHVEGSDNKLIYLEVLSLEPRVFDVFNFFSRDESKELVDRAVAEKSESHRIKRSSTGASGYSVNSRRTSESGFDTHGKTATKVKKRCLKSLGFDEYWESHGDGLQILRYNVSSAYNSHMDWIEDKSGQLEHDYESGGTGGNRFATILMYMSDLEPEDGGETVFPKGWPPNVAVEDRVDPKMAVEQLRASDRGKVLSPGSWEEDLTAKCRTRLSIRPHSSRAVLFYSQFPNGEVDPASLHGACPVLSGVKYAANLWVWNTPRTGYPGAPIKEKFRKEGEKQKVSNSPSVAHKMVKAIFSNTGQDPTMKDAKLYYREDQFWMNLGHDDPETAANTYEGHVWNVKVDGKIVKTWEISETNGDEQLFTI